MYTASIELSKERDSRKVFEFFINWGIKNNQIASLICDRHLIDNIIDIMQRNHVATLIDEIVEGENCLILEIYWSNEEILSTRWIKAGEKRLILESIEVLARNINLSGKEPIYTPSSKSWTEELVIFLY